MRILKNTFLLLFVLQISTSLTIEAKKNDSSLEKKLAHIQALEKNGQYQMAMSESEALYQNNQNHIELVITYASQLVKSNNPEKAQAIVQPFTKDTANDWRIWFWLGSAQLLNSDLENASDSLSKALSLKGDEISIWIQQAIVEQEKGNSKAALNLLQVANNLQPNNPDVLVNYAYASEKEGKVNQAIKLYRYFLRLSASDKRKGVLRSEIMLRLAQIASAQSLVSNQVETQETIN